MFAPLICGATHRDKGVHAANLRHVSDWSPLCGGLGALVSHNVHKMGGEAVGRAVATAQAAWRQSGASAVATANVSLIWGRGRTSR
eukprot:1857649-Amphidinium_carterae.2